MIASLRGNITEKSVEGLIVDVNGVGYDVHVSLSTFYSLPDEGEKATLLIYTHVKEDSLKLFGFKDRREKGLFIKLIGVSGVGPKLALNILSGMETEELLGALSRGDLVRLNAIPGVGKKTAERLIVDLKDKVKYEGPAETGEALPGDIESDIVNDVQSALLNLGYKKGDIEKSLNRITTEEEPFSFEKLLKETLKSLSK